MHDGKLIYLREKHRNNKHHLSQIWQTPFSKELLPNIEKADSLLYKIGNKDIVRVMAESQELITLLNKKDSYSGLYDDIVKLSTFILDTYYFLGEDEVQKLDAPLKEIRAIAHSAINEYEKVVEQRKNTEEALEKIKQSCEKILDDTKRLHYSQLTEYIDALSQIRALRGEVTGARELKYADTALLDKLEKSLADRYTELSNACVEFLLQEEHYCHTKKGHSRFPKISLDYRKRLMPKQLKKISIPFPGSLNYWWISLITLKLKTPPSLPRLLKTSL